jgi:hypothetical protein
VAAGRAVLSRRRELDAVELEGRRHRAADERPGAERHRRLPPPLGHDDLWYLARCESGTEHHVADVVTLDAALR